MGARGMTASWPGSRPSHCARTVRTRPPSRAAAATGDGPQITDEQTSSTWDVLGRAMSGPLEHKQPTAIPHSGSQLWFSWAVFQPNTEVYENRKVTIPQHYVTRLPTNLRCRAAAAEADSPVSRLCTGRIRA